MPATRRQLAAAMVVIAVAVALRLPFVSHYLWAWDSVLYANAVADFDVSAGRPDPPGYLFYILLARLVALGTRDPNLALVTVSVVAGACVVGLGLFLGWRMFGALTGALTAGILLADPLLWQYSEIAYPYTLLALLAGGVGAALWRSSHGPRRQAVVASLALGLAAGFRQDLLLVLWPLWLWSTTRQGPRAFALSALAAGVGCLVWLVPSALLSGGLGTYVALTEAQLIGVSPLSGRSSSVTENLLLLLIGVRWQLLWALPLAALGVGVVVGRRGMRPAIWPFVLWIVPACLTYLLLHIGEWAYTLSIAVPLALLAAIGGAALVGAARPHLVQATAVAALALLLVLNAHSFVLGAGRFTARSITGHDAGLAIWIAHMRATYPPERTLLLARESYLHARYYLPEYLAIYVRERPVIARRQLGPLPPGIDRVVLFLGEVVPDARTTFWTLRLASGITIPELPLPRGSRIFIEDGLVLVENAAQTSP